MNSKYIKKLLTIGLLSISLLLPSAVAADTPTPNPTPTPTTTPATTTAAPVDTDGDEIPDASDNCPTVANPNQKNRDNNSVGDACDVDFQRNWRANHRENTEAQIQALQTTNSAEQLNAVISSFGECIIDANQVQTDTQQICTKSPKNEALKNLAEAYRQNQIVSVLEEPISNENLYQRAQICTSKYLRDANGFLQYTNTNQQTINFDEDLEAQIQAQQARIDAANNNDTVAISIDKCRTTYVTQCNPNSTYNREVSLTDPLPVIVTCSTVQLLFADSGVDLLKQYINLIYRWAAGIIGILAVLVIMINGIMISLAGGDDGKVSEAKQRIIQSLTALAILFLAGIILYTINPNFFTTSDLQYDFDAVENPEQSDPDTPSTEPETPSEPPATPTPTT